MPDFSRRSYQKELLDRDDIPFKDILRNMTELDNINKLLGGHAITCSGLAAIIKVASKAPDHEWNICEIGCGNGNNLAVLYNWCRKHKINAKLTGIDINPHCIAAADPGKSGPESAFIASDYRQVVFEHKPDIIFSSLFCHHFTDDEMVDQLQWLRNNSSVAFFINDLHRNIFAFYSIRVLSRLFSKSYLVKNDAPLSVLRGFTRFEWMRLMQRSGIDNFSVKWKWAFRWLVVVVT